MHFDRFTGSSAFALSFGALTVVVTLIGAAVVKQHFDGEPTVDLVESVAATR